MSQNSINLTQDTVIKMTVKQGVEADRTSSTYGKFDTGELAFTRDTKRIFVGDCNMTDSPNNVQITGGSISGNKYLGIVDSKKKLNTDNNGIPLDYEEDKILTSGSKFRVSTNSNNRWSTKAYYNSTTDAYDGDYLYDVYTNSIIFFDHRITTKEKAQPTGLDDGGVAIESGVKGKRITKLENYFVQDIGGDSDSKTQGVKTYGEGYVVFRNVIPDNKTIRFVNREFDKSTGNPSNTDKGTYSHNVLEVFNIPTEKLKASFDTNIFTTDDKISLKYTLPVDELKVRTTTKKLTLPNSLSFTDGSKTATYTFATSLQGKTETNYKLQVLKSSGNNFTIGVIPSTTESTEVLKISLGNGLEAVGPGNSKSSTLTVGDTTTKLSLKNSMNTFNDYYKDPFYTDTNDSTIYIGDVGYDENGLLSIIEDYSSSYKNADRAGSYINKFQNINSSFNLFKEPFFLAWTGVSGAYTSAFSVNLQGTIYEFPHIVNREIYAGTTTLTDNQKTYSLMTVGYSGLTTTAETYRIPHTATSILIEMTNDTSNPIYVVTAGSFDNLKKFTKSLPTTTTGVFWSVSNSSSLPSLVTTDYWNSLNSYEKALKNLPAKSREIVEVPLVITKENEIDPENNEEYEGDETKDFFLRISNITEATSASFAMRVVGYRS